MNKVQTWAFANAVRSNEPSASVNGEQNLYRINRCHFLKKVFSSQIVMKVASTLPSQSVGRSDAWLVSYLVS
jgi:hypothetical protein